MGNKERIPAVEGLKKTHGMVNRTVNMGLTANPGGHINIEELSRIVSSPQRKGLSRKAPPRHIR